MRIRHDFSSKKTGKFKKSPHNNKHRVEFPKVVKDVIRTSDIVLEVVDARFIDKTRNLEMEKYVLEMGKKLIFVLNKADLISVNELKMNYDLDSIKPYVLFSNKNRVGRTRLKTMLKIEVKKMKLTMKARVGVIGYPNTGKSSLINALAGRKGASTSAQAGHTRGAQKIRLTEDILLLDTPGVFLESEHPDLDGGDLNKHTHIGVKTYDKVKDPDFLVMELMNSHPGKFEELYGIEANGDSELLLEEIGKRRHFLKKGGVVDIQRAARAVLKDWQDGKIR